ncbi:MAG: PepSY domain-containing protein [Bacteroidetes bacterium]|nr:MAG: PepSY domain-containing protein [Bacteroidota bacterium]
MSTAPSSHTATTAAVPDGPSVPTGAAAPRATSLRAALWRWHFWIGLLVAPILLVIAVTGALYVFKDEIQAVVHRDLYFVGQPENQLALPFERRLAAARDALEASWTLAGLNRTADPGRADEFIFERPVGTPESAATEGHEHVHRFVYVDPYTAEVLGHIDLENSFFGLVLRLHRTLLAGTAGRLVTELATSWSIISVITGLTLWWSRRRQYSRPRRPAGQAAPRTRHRRFHILSGVNLGAVMLVIMVTGLLFTTVWGRAALAGLYFGGQLPAAYVNPPKSSPVDPDAAPPGIDAIIAEARTHFPFAAFRLVAPETPQAPWIVLAPTQNGSLADGAVYIDTATGHTLDAFAYASLAPGAKAALLFYPIHTGSIFGLPTKLLAVVACLALGALCITGVRMWWIRRPAGRFGAPASTHQARIPNSALAAIIGLGCLLPLAGATMLLLGGVHLTRKAVARLHPLRTAQ